MPGVGLGVSDAGFKAYVGFRVRLGTLVLNGRC